MTSGYKNGKKDGTQENRSQANPPSAKRRFYTNKSRPNALEDMKAKMEAMNGKLNENDAKLKQLEVKSKERDSMLKQLETNLKEAAKEHGAKLKQLEADFKQIGAAIQSLEKDNEQLSPLLLDKLESLMVPWIRAHEEGMLRVKLPFDYFRLGGQLRLDLVEAKISNKDAVARFNQLEDVKKLKALFKCQAYKDILATSNSSMAPMAMSRSAMKSLADGIKPNHLSQQDQVRYGKCMLLMAALDGIEGSDEYIKKFNKSLK